MNIDDLIEQLTLQGIHNEIILGAFRKIPRELFVLNGDETFAYDNIPLPIQANQTISQPYVIAKMTQALCETGSIEKVLEIGTGSGYQTAILAQCAKQVFTVERVKLLHQLAKKRIAKLNISNVQFQYGDGYLGWSEQAPYDAIMVTAATTETPQILINQLNENGRMVIPVGDFYSQDLLLVTKNQNQIETTLLDPVRFVPLLHGIE